MEVAHLETYGFFCILHRLLTMHDISLMGTCVMDRARLETYELFATDVNDTQYPADTYLCHG